MTTGGESANLGRQLDRAARRAEEALRRERTRAALGPAAELGLRVAFLAALVLFIAALLPGIGWGSSAPTRLPLVLLLPLLAGGAAFGLFLWRARDADVARQRALSAADGVFDLEDRLATADEFLHVARPTSFTAAALEDARDGARRAAESPWPREVPITAPGRAALALGAAALLLALGASRLVRDPRASAPIPATDPTLARLDPAPANDPGEDPMPPQPVEVDPPERRDAAALAPSGNAPAAVRDASRLSEEVKPSTGRTRSGESSEASGASGSSASRGTPSNQSQQSAEPAKQGSKKPKKPAEEPRPEGEPKPRDSEEDSGATAGRGSGRGPTRNPATTDWSSKDNVESADEDAPGDDEEIEDEESDSEARGGVQPSLRDRRPPVSRDLQIGFGNQPSPDANGRGGPSEQKKSRGTASLVLGIPIPDHIKGQANPGKTKVTQERVEPAPEDAVAATSGSRAPRASAFGAYARPELTPWMRDLVRDYFLTLRNRSEGIR